MKKTMWAVLGLFIGTLVVAEQINAIMFNPSRLGLYQQLRVTKQVKSSGNLTAGTTYVKGDTTASANSYEIVNVNAQKGTVDMRGGETEMVVNGPMNIKGGKAQFTAASTLPQLPTNTWIKADEGGLTMGNVTLNGNGNKFNIGTLRGLELGPNDIPLAPSECTGALDWVERKASDGSIYQVLAVKGCGVDECTVNPNQEKCCPLKKLNDSSVQWWDGSTCQTSTCYAADNQKLKSMCNFSGYCATGCIKRKIQYLVTGEVRHVIADTYASGDPCADVIGFEGGSQCWSYVSGRPPSQVYQCLGSSIKKTPCTAGGECNDCALGKQYYRDDPITFYQGKAGNHDETCPASSIYKADIQLYNCIEEDYDTINPNDLSPRFF